MSRKQWLIVAFLALANVLVLGAMAVVIARSMVHSSSVPSAGPTPIPLPLPTATPFPTWTPTLSPTPELMHTPRPTKTPTATPTPWPTPVPTAPPTPTSPPSPAPVPLNNPTFEGIQENLIPGWHTGAFVNWAPGQKFDAGTSYAAPRFHQADDPRQRIDGATLQIDTVNWVKLRAWVFQAVELEAGSRVQFQVEAAGFVKDTAGGYILKAGVDPDGGEGCEAAQWGEEQILNQNSGVAALFSPEAVAGSAGRVTVCMFAETQYAQIYHAAFFDNAALTVLPPASP